MSRRFLLAALGAWCVLTIAGCSTTATILLKNGESIEGKIEWSDAEWIYVADGPAVVRKDVEDIDHPGNVIAIIGTSVGAAGLAIAIWGFAASSNCNNETGDSRGLCSAATLTMGIPGLAIAVPSTIVTIWGWVIYGRSKSAASPPDKPGPIVIPIALTDGERKYLGLGLSWRW